MKLWDLLCQFRYIVSLNIAYCLYFSCCYTKKDHAQLSLQTWINIVEDKMVAIDRYMYFYDGGSAGVWW